MNDAWHAARYAYSGGRIEACKIDNGLHAAFLASLDGLSDEPLRRAAQIALKVIERIIAAGDGTIETDVAYDALQAALAGPTTSAQREMGRIVDDRQAWLLLPHLAVALASPER